MTYREYVIEFLTAVRSIQDHGVEIYLKISSDGRLVHLTAGSYDTVLIGASITETQIFQKMDVLWTMAIGWPRGHRSSADYISIYETKLSN